jgi:hypothetical protein
MHMVAAPALPATASPDRVTQLHAVPAAHSPVDPGLLTAAIEYHREESRRLAKIVEQHRTHLRDLLRQRDQHMNELRSANWSLARIGRLYKVTKERVGQITAALRAENEKHGEQVRAA